MRAAALLLELHKRRQVQQAAIERLQLHPGQLQVRAEARRYNVVNCGRRWGKTQLGIDLVRETLMAGGRVAWLAPNYKYLIEAWADLARSLQPITARKNATERRIETTTGGVLECWTLEDPDSGRSRSHDRAIYDEAAKAQHLQVNWEQAITATLGDRVGDAWFLSTPKGRNFFWQLYQRGQDPLEPDYMSWQLPTINNPYFPPAEVEEQRRNLPQVVFEQEYLAEFTEAAMLFRYVRECIRARQDGPIEGHFYVMGVDWAQRVDFTVLCVIDATTRQVVEIDRFNQIDYFTQRDRLTALASRWNVNYILAEENSIGIPNIEELQRAGLPVEAFHTTNDSKTAIIQALVGAFERGEIGILDDRVLIGELESYEAERLPSGKWKYSAPEGMHDDTVIALALAWWVALSAGPSILIEI